MASGPGTGDEPPAGHRLLDAMTARRRSLLLVTCLLLVAAGGALTAASQSRAVRRYALQWVETRFSESLGR